MPNSDKLILVTGATGQQGGATARHLLANGWRVRALTRDPNKPAARALAQAGAEVVRGDLDDRTSLEAALKDVYGVFSVQNNWLPEVGLAGEVRQGQRLAEAAKAAGVRHFVYTSVGGAERNTGIPHFESKWQIEQFIHALGLPVTVLRPVAFMENYYWDRPAILNGTLASMGLRPDKTHQLIAVDDIGALAALAFAKPEACLGQSLEIAGDPLTELQIAETFSRVIGRPMQLVPMAWQPDPEMLKMFQWFDQSGYQADVPALRKLHPPLKTLETWLRETGWENAQPVPQAELSQRG